MDLVIGRDGQTSQLNVSAGQKVYRFFAAESVPTSVSRQHCIITVKGEDNYVIRNIKATNVTYVNGIEIEEKSVTLSDKIELGRERYMLNLSFILGKLMPQQQPKKTIDITPLQQIWDDYNAEELRLKKQQKNIGMLASVPMGFTMLGGLLTGVCPPIRPYAIIFTAIALIIMVYGFYKRYTDNTLEKLQQLKNEFQQKYVCPNPDCRHFMGMTPYASLKSKSNCPYCKAKIES